MDDAKILEEEREWRQARDHERATAQTARSIGMLAMVDVGWSVYSRTEGEPDCFVMDATGETVGGIVLEVGAKVVVKDAEAGEIERLRSFTTIDPYSLRYHCLTEKQVDPELVMPPDAGMSHRAIGALAKSLVLDGRRAKSLLADEERRLATVATMHQLAAGLRRRMGA